MKTNVLGIDVSKETLDLVTLQIDQVTNHEQIPNTVTALKKYLQAKLTELGEAPSSWLVCTETTGIYCNHVIEVCAELALDLWIEDAGRIKAFHSLSRGKNDA